MCIKENIIKYSIKVKQSSYRLEQVQRVDRGIVNPFVTSALEGGVWSASRPGRFTTGNDSVPIVQEDRWGPGPIWTCAKNLAPYRDSIPGRPARIQSLYRLSYTGPIIIYRTIYCKWAGIA
jgi:hypothetical protein